MNLKKSFLTVCCFAMLLTLSSAEWQGRPRKNNSKITEQNGIVKVGGAEAMAMTVRFFDVKGGNKYKITGAVRIPKGKQRFYFGMMCYDKNGKQIQGGEAVPVQDAAAAEEEAELLLLIIIGCSFLSSCFCILAVAHPQ